MEEFSEVKSGEREGQDRISTEQNAILIYKALL